MTEDGLEALRYPIGRFAQPKDTGPERRVAWLAAIRETPARLAETVAGLDDAQLDTPYRPDGWTVRQVVHHLPDSHMNSYVRFRLALTEDVPTIRPYEEARWAELPDARTGPIAWSLDLLAALHQRWVSLLASLDDADYGRRFRHPEIGELTLGENLALYAWHGAHHVAHITRLRDRESW